VERACLAEHLEELQTGSSGLLILEGEAGMGKSRLVADLLQQARERGIRSLVGAGGAVEKSTPYHAWSPIFGELFQLDELSDTEARRAPLLERLRAAPELLPLAPLLNAVLPLDLPDNEITAQLTGSVRADNLHELLVRVLQAATTGGPAPQPLLVVLEDAHWLDSASWALASLVPTRVRPLLMVLAMRPLADPLPEECRPLIEGADAHRLHLDALPSEDTRALVCERLGISTLPEPVAALIEQRAGGNPFFSEELASALRDAGLILITEGVCQIAPGAGDLGGLTLPDTVQGVIASRIDRLMPSHQLTLKVASVIGRVFAYRILREIHPVDADKPYLRDYLDALQRLDITQIDSSEPDLTYLFKHAIIQEVAYNLMLFGQRRQLHRAAAECFERAQAENLTSFYPLLAYHWGKAEVPAKTIEYSAKAGEQALNSGAYREAVLFLNEALTIDARETQPIPPRRERRAHWERQLGEAHLGLGHPTEGREHLRQAAALLGWPAPTTRGRLAVSLAAQLLRQGWNTLLGATTAPAGGPYPTCLHRLWPARFVARRSRESGASLEAARAYIRLVETYWFANETAPLVNAGVSALNLAEAAGPYPELARAYAMMCLAAGSVPLHSLAEMYGRRARETAIEVQQLFPQAYALFITSVYGIGVGKWTDVRESLDQAAEIFERLGDRRLRETASRSLR
jgi:hypothetical protein